MISDKRIDLAFIEFDARRKGLGQFKYNEKDSFRSVIKQMLRNELKIEETLNEREILLLPTLR